MDDQNFDLIGNSLPPENPDGSVDIPLDQTTALEYSSFYDNIVDTIDPYILNSIAGEFIERLEKDKEAREKRDKQYEEGLRRTGLGDDAPGGAQFEGASRVVHPILAEACVDFSARAIKELFPSKGPVKTHIEGKADKEKLKKAENKAAGMNWQFTKGIQEYRDELEQLLTQTPMGGSQYQKFWVEEGEIRTEFVSIDNILLPFVATSFYRSPRVTHVQDITKSVFEARVTSGLYREIDNLSEPETPDATASQKANNKIEGKDDTDAYNEDGLRRVFEIYTWLELEEGKKAPYILTIDEHTEEPLALYRNWAEDDPKMRKLDWFVEYKFIPWRGAYGIGLPHLIGGLSAALTGALRALMDSAHINNAATMLKLKGGRVTGQNTSVEVTQVSEIEAPAGVDDVRKIAMPMPFNPPSPVLFQLLGFLENASKSVVATAEDMMQNVGQNTPVGTTLALIEQGSAVYSSVHARLHASQQKAMEIISRLNRTFPEVLEEVNQHVETPLTPEDFADNDDVQPVSDPNIFSETQRYAQFQAVVQLAADPRCQWDIPALYRIGMELLKFPYADEVLPSTPDPERANPVDENVFATKGMPLAAHADQDHKAHLIAHLLFCTSPIFGANPLMGTPTVPTLVQHCKEHLVMLYDQHAKAAVEALGELGMMASGEGDDDIHKALALADQQLAQELSQIMPMLEQAMKIAQQFAPQPPVDPAVQVQEKIGMAEIARKTELDKSTAAMKQQELGLKQQAEQQKQVFDQQKAAADHQLKVLEDQRKADQQLFEQKMTHFAQLMENQREQLTKELELRRNEDDNRYHMITELLKNREDNETQKIIELMKQQVQEAVQSVQVPQQQDPTAGLEPLIIKLEQMIGQMKQDDRMASVMEGLQAAIQSVNAPKAHQLVKGPDGKTIGIVSKRAE